jgi:ribosomal subunit interface protein
MIVNITFRHNTKLDGLDQWVESQIKKLERFASKITQISIVFSKVSNKKNSTSSVRCHISLHAPEKVNIDIYENKSNSNYAFNSAYEKMINALSRTKLGIYYLHQSKNNTKLDSLDC